jgi:hypothetical protein
MKKFEHITGQLFFRLSADRKPGEKDPRKLFAVVGVLAVPDRLMIQDGHIYTITGSEPKMTSLFKLVDPDFDDGTPKDIYNMELHRVTGWDYSKESIGSSIGQILCHPIWRV